MADRRLKRIMSEDERLFQAMSPGQFAKGAPAVRGESKKPVSDRKQSAKKKRDQKKAVSGVSQFFVSVGGVVDAIQRTMASVSLAPQETSKKVEPSPVAEQGPSEAAPVEAFISSGYRGPLTEEAASGDTESLSDGGDAGPNSKLEIQDFDVSEPVEADLQFADPSSQQEMGPIDAMREDPSEVEVEAPLVDQETFDPQAKESREIESIANDAYGVEDDVEDSEPGVNPLVQKRRERYERERQAAARNYQRNQQVGYQSPPVMGIPNPTPMQHADQDHGVNAAANPDEKALAIDESVNAASELAKSMVDLMDKFSTEMQALSVRVRNLELAMDRF